MFPRFLVNHLSSSKCDEPLLPSFGAGLSNSWCCCTCPSHCSTWSKLALENLKRQQKSWKKPTDMRVDTVDGWNPAPVEVGSLSNYLQGFIHPRWLFGFLPSTVGELILFPRDPLTERQRMMMGVLHHLRNAKSLGSISILSFGGWIPRGCILFWNITYV